MSQATCLCRQASLGWLGNPEESKEARKYLYRLNKAYGLRPPQTPPPPPPLPPENNATKEPVTVTVNVKLYTYAPPAKGSKAKPRKESKNKKFDHLFEKGESAHMKLIKEILAVFKITHLNISEKPCILKLSAPGVRAEACAISLEDVTEYDFVPTISAFINMHDLEKKLKKVRKNNTNTSDDSNADSEDDVDVGPLPSMPATSQSSFTRNDNDKFIKYLRDHKGEAGDGGNFKKVFWHSMVPYMEQYRTRGAPKSATSLKNKWNWHRAQYKAIKLIQSPSGWGAYDEEQGAGVNADTQDSWTEFTARHPECKPYARTRGIRGLTRCVFFAVFCCDRSDQCQQGASLGDDQPSQDADADADATMEEEEEEKELPQAMGEEEDDGFVIIESDRHKLLGSQNVNTTTSSSHNTAPKPSSSAATHGSTAAAATTSSKRRQPASASSALKRTSRVPPSVTVMQGMVDQLSAFNTTFRDSFGPPPSSGLPPTPVCRRDCAACVEEEDWMTAEAQAFFSMILEKDTPAMDTYMGKKGEESRKAYVKLKLQEHSYWSPPEKDVISNMFSSDF
ncbi:uncharacterized protein SCHCODRAFT_01110848 [Schizophyllum commune H4-8]|nr:uncharacterized protein SCHCODRAFT_01110848 [Schizophyllum commune H4-8]KAI5886523.1 hypothetical protein SCHCODRAFT_01110848 [Schizophyllum commune H4-8]